MARKKVFTKGDLFAINKLKEQGLSNREIAEKFHVSVTTIKRYLTNFKVYSDWSPGKGEKPAPAASPAAAKPVAQPATKSPAPKEEKNETAKKIVLSQISSRVMIKELYNRGYRIENGDFFVIEKRKVLVSDILAEA